MKTCALNEDSTVTQTTDLIAITRDIIAAIHQFKGVLAEESEALAQTDKTALLEIAARKIRYADHLDALVKSRSRMFRMLGVNETDRKAISDMFATLGQNRLFQQDWGQAMETLRECQELNQRANASIQLQSSYVRRGLEVLNGKPLHHSYSANGHFIDDATAKELGTA